MGEGLRKVSPCCRSLTIPPATGNQSHRDNEKFDVPFGTLETEECAKLERISVADLCSWLAFGLRANGSAVPFPFFAKTAIGKVVSPLRTTSTTYPTRTFLSAHGNGIYPELHSLVPCTSSPTCDSVIGRVTERDVLHVMTRRDAPS